MKRMGIKTKGHLLPNAVSVLLVIIAVFLQACASDTRLRKLDDTIKVYSDTLRWGRIEDAALLVVNKGSINPDFVRNIRITSYTERQRTVDEEAKTAKSVVEIRYYNEEIGRELRLIDNQQWTYFEDNDTWLLTSDVPSFFDTVKQ